MTEPIAGCNWVTRTPAGMAVSQTSLTGLVAVDMRGAFLRDASSVASHVLPGFRLAIV
jgi:hypothetical protein